MIIRWVSEDGKRKWMYPIKQDIHTKGRIAKQVSTKAKVIGITKVNIPSPLHPIIPYYVLLLEDEYGNRIPKKTMKEHKIGEAYEIKPAKTDGAVVITKIKYDTEEYLKESLKLLHDYKINPEDKILIKPSIIEAAYGYQAVTTNPNLLDALLSILKGNDVRDIIVAEQSMLGNDTIESAKKSEIWDICKKHGINFVDLAEAEYVEKEYEGFKFNIAKGLFERKIINLPVMKTNSQIGISGAVENMVRAVDAETQKRMFADDIEKTLPKLFKVLPSFLTIGDATIGMQAQGPTSLGEPAFLNMLVVSKDPVALDAVFAEMGILEIPAYIKEASKIGVGNANTKTMEIVGEDLEAIKLHLRPADKNASSHPKIKLIDGKANPYIFNSALEITSKLIGLLGEEINLVIGSQIIQDMLNGKSRLVAYGKEAIEKLREFGIKPVAEISEDIDDTEKVMLLKAILENPEKKGINIADKIKSKIAKIGAKIKGKF
ncbi:MAG: DUF362 domain-containing protein [Nanoarchaeota archaeon]